MRQQAWAVIAACLAPVCLAAGVARAAELAPDTPHVLVLPPSNGHRVFVLDTPAAHDVDGKIHVMDGDTFRTLGEVPNGFFGAMTVSHDGATLFSATSYFARGDHGARTDVVEFYGTRSLALEGEVVLPPKRVQTTGYAAYLPESAHGAYLLVQNATPASSVTVVDVAHRRVLAEIPTAGCIGIYPSPLVEGRFSSLCGDGAAVTVDFAADGHETGRHRSARFFDPDGDAIFVAGVTLGEKLGGKTLFVSFLGNVRMVDFSGPAAAADDAWPLVAGADAAAGWRPGGYQLLAYNAETGQAYVGMHAHGVEGSHKLGAEQVWRVDLASHTLKARGPGGGSAFVAVSGGAHPVVFTSNLDTGVESRLDGESLALLGRSPEHGIVESGGLMVVQ
jgi:methylamine dehydrogenase heavy chain